LRKASCERRKVKGRIGTYAFIELRRIAMTVLFLAASSPRASAQDFKFLNEAKEGIVERVVRIIGWLKPFVGEPKDWVVGIVAGVIGGLIVIVLASLRIPKLEISNRVVITNRQQRIKVINRRRRWWPVLRGDAINVSVRMHVMKESGRTSKPLGLSPSEIPILFHRKFWRKSCINEYVFHVEHDLKSEFERKGVKSLRFQITATDSFSNYSRTYSQTYFKKGSREVKSDYEPIVIGDFKGPGDVRVIEEKRAPSTPAESRTKGAS
jgi:hypothetical protein